MPPSLSSRATQELARRLRRLAWLVRALILLGAPVLLAVPLLQALAPEWLASTGTTLVHPELQRLSQAGVTPAMLRRLALVSLLPVGLGLLLLWQLWQLFGEYLQGAVFGARALACLRRFAAGVLLLGLVQSATRPLAAVAASWDNPPGQRMVELTLSTDDYGLLLVGLVLLAIARVMTEAARVAEENEGFV